MVLKRKRDGEFVPWRTAPLQPSSSTAGRSSPPRPAVPSSAMPSSSSSSTMPTQSYAPSRMLNPVMDLPDDEDFHTPTIFDIQTEQEGDDIPPRTRKRGRASTSATASAPTKVRPKRTCTMAKKAPAPPPVPAPAPEPACEYALPPMAGPSTLPPPVEKPKRGRKSKAAAGESAAKPEKRQAQFKPRCPQNIMDRVERVMSQRIFMIDRHRVNGELKEEFKILGTTMNVYTVTLDHKPRCTCPDHAVKGNHCKHILFVFLKVLQVTQDSGVWYQKALLTSELESIFTSAPPAPNSLAHARVREAYAIATGTKLAELAAEPAKPTRRVPQEDDDCPICYDGMHGVAEVLLVFCDGCGNALHKECWGQWQQTSRNQGKPLTCVWCRAPWALPAAAGALTPTRPGRPGSNYINLSGVGGAGISPERDTSTYYHGPRRGQRYIGYNV